METDKIESKELKFSKETKFELKNYIDQAILQTMIDSEKYNDGPLKILEKPLFKADKSKKPIDELLVRYSAILPLLYKTYESY